MRDLPPLRAIVAFEAAARLGSMVLAAAELGIGASAVSHRIATLEAHFGQPLFSRSAGGLVLSASGARLAARVAGALAELAAASRDYLAAPEPATVAVHVAVSLAVKWLRPRLGGFVAAHPAVALRVVDAPGRPAAGAAFDFAILYGLDAPSGARRLLAERVRPLCSPALRRRLPPVVRPADLLALPLLHSRSAVDWPDWFRRVDAPPPPTGGLRFDRSHIAIDAACEGLGVILESDLLTEAERGAGRLVPLFTETRATMPSTGYRLLEPPRPPSAAASAFLGWLRAEAARRA